MSSSFDVDPENFALDSWFQMGNPKSRMPDFPIDCGARVSLQRLENENRRGGNAKGSVIKGLSSFLVNLVQ